MLEDNDAKFDIVDLEDDFDEVMRFEIPAEILQGENCEQEIMKLVMLMTMPTSPTKH